MFCLIHAVVSMTIPAFFLEELQQELRRTFSDLNKISVPTICCAFRHDLKISRKVLGKEAREVRSKEISDFKYRLNPLYLYTEQLVFVDETSKDSRSSFRRYAWSAIGTPAQVNLPFSRGKRVLTLSVFNHTGFFAWGFTPDSFTRHTFRDTFEKHILPHFNPWLLSNSIVIIDNARIHMYQEFLDMDATRGALVVFLPPFCAQRFLLKFEECAAAT